MVKKALSQVSVNSSIGRFIELNAKFVEKCYMWLTYICIVIYHHVP